MLLELLPKLVSNVQLLVIKICLLSELFSLKVQEKLANFIRITFFRVTFIFPNLFAVLSFSGIIAKVY
jgi:hypothetical protein